VVYLVRTSDMTDDWEEGWATLTDIADPTERVHRVLSFESLADEEPRSITEPIGGRAVPAGNVEGR
jgi:hypothetical protein